MNTEREPHDPLVKGTPYDKPVVDPHDQTTKWRSWRINRSFLIHMQTKYPQGFTYAEAYQLYANYHWEGKDNARTGYIRALAEHLDPQVTAYLRTAYRYGDNWMQMNVRNHICAAVYRGLPIRRTGRGKFEWTGALP